MSVYCHVILKPDATPGQFTTLGAALWRWCTRAAGGTGVYRYLDNQALADLVAGLPPTSGHTTWSAERHGLLYGVRDGAFPDLRAVIDSLRREIPPEGIEDIVVEGGSWCRAG